MAQKPFAWNHSINAQPKQNTTTATRRQTGLKNGC